VGVSPFDPELLRVLVIGADPLARGGICAALDALDGVQLAGAWPELIAPVEALAPSALIWDVAAGGLPGSLPAPPVLALAPDARSASEAMARGAAGVLARDGDRARLAAALRAVDCGMRVVDEAFAATVLGQGLRRGRPPEEPLTPRELDALALLAEGLSNRGIARRLGVSEHTAKFHVNAILSKLDARSRTDAVVRALRLGLLRL
jgi:two-component system nitrate/nitrite response regulator NarL